MTARVREIRALYQARPRSLTLRISLLLLGALVAASWASGELAFGDLLSSRRAANAARFAREVLPYPLRDRPFEWSAALEWAGGLLRDGGYEALGATLAIAVAAAVLAAAWGALLCLPAARTFSSPDAFAVSPRRANLPARLGSTGVVALTRAVLIFVRAIPEYVWAFLLIAIFGFTAWPAVLALAIHNAGILGKLMSESVENADPEVARSLRALGASRLQVAAVGILPEVLPRFLLYFFYRWETCVREATVLGMLGVLSLGSLIRDARAANFYDEMIFYVLLGALLVLAGDLASALARALIRRAG